MKALIFLTVIGLSTSPLQAQNTDKFRVKSGEEAEKAIPASYKYRYDTFRNGSVSFYGGRSATARLNYNLLVGEMQFIDLTGDTLSLADEQTIQHIKIEENTFYYDPKYGYLEVVAQYPAVKLTLQQSFSTVSKEKKGAYEQSTGASSIKNYNSYASGNTRLQKLDPDGDVLIAREVGYFLVDENNRAHRANKSNVLKLFAKQKKAISTYLDEADIDFDKEEDLRQLLQFCSELNF
jgi:hypothetical protein